MRPVPQLCPKEARPSQVGTLARMRAFALGAVSCVLAVGTLSGCATRYIPNTDVADSPDNRRIVAFCEAYRKAVERGDIVRLVELADPSYYEAGGNVDASDDIDFAGLKAYLVDKFQKAENIRYEIRYRRITIGAEVVQVDFTYSGSFRVPAGNSDTWRNTVEENRLQLVARGDSFAVIAGM